jgi:hypothetical protein
MLTANKTIDPIFAKKNRTAFEKEIAQRTNQ